MNLSEQIIDDFIRIYRDEFGKEITRDQAREAASRMVALYQLLLRPLPGETTGKGVDGKATMESGQESFT